MKEKPLLALAYLGSITKWTSIALVLLALATVAYKYVFNIYGY